MKMKAFVKSTVREMKDSFARYLAILVITALGVGFFAGLRACRPALTDSVGTYFETQNFYDFYVLSSLGFSKDGLSGFTDLPEISAAEGSVYEDVLVTVDENDLVFRIRSVPEEINKLTVVSGKLPENDGECVVDADYFTDEAIGQTLVLSAGNSEETLDAFGVSEFTVVGTVTSPLYISLDRGTSSVGDGTVAAVVFVNESCFTADYYKEIYLTLEDEAEVYSDAYEKLVDGATEAVTQTAKEQAQLRYQEIVTQAAFLTDASTAVLESAVLPPSVYVLTRNENAGYAAFEQDSTIIENISVVFPVFFFLVAALVCVTTMTRMVDEQRTQIGVLKAMGYTRGKISCKYLFYAGSAGLIGSILGFFAGTGMIPMIFWYAYHTLYNFTDRLSYVFDPLVYWLSLGITMVCTLGATLSGCQKALREVPAAILRPKAPKNGKRIFLERFKIWRHIGFLRKVSLRNVVRYKQRFFLMILGIGGCTALILTGFGIRDSIQNVTDYQYGEIVLYDAKVTFADTLNEEEQEAFLLRHDGVSVLFLSECVADITFDGVTKSIQATAAAGGTLSSFLDLHDGDVPVPYPQDGEAVLSRGIAEKLNVAVGDTVVLTGDSFLQVVVTVTGVFDNYVENYMFVSDDTVARLNEDASVNAAYAAFLETDDVSVAAADLLSDSYVSYVSLNADMRESIETSFSSLNLVVLLIILCAGILAFIVLFNLININIGERIREIATIKVLGFFSAESSAYVFREVNILTAAGAVLGLIFGRFLHGYVMAQVKPDQLCFDSRIAWSSYLFSVAVTVAFEMIVKIFMRFKLKRISMAESLKSVE